jgi:hypothetical protein
MVANIGLPPKPEEQELSSKRQELKDLENELVEHELHLATLKGELAAFEKEYLRIVGVKYAELDEIEAQIAELRARNEPRNLEAQAAAQNAHRRAEESRANTVGLAPNARRHFSNFPVLRGLYRHIARTVHPDLATNESDRAKRQALMAEANRAYEEGDETRLKAILQEYESSPESVPGEGTAAELIRVIRKIAQVKTRLSEIAEENRKLMESELFVLKTRVDEENKRGRDILKEMAAAVGLRISEAQASLKKIAEAQSA